MQVSDGDRHSSPFRAKQTIANWLARIGRETPAVRELAAERLCRPARAVEMRRFIAKSLISRSFVCPRALQPLDCMKVILQIRGLARMRMLNCEITLHPTQWVLNDFSRRIEVELSEDCEQLLLIFPADFFFRKRSLASDVAFVPFGTEPGVARLAGRFFMLLLQDWDYLSVPEQTDMVDAAAQMMQIAITEWETARRTVTISETVRERVKAHVDRHLRDCNLSIGRIAESLGVTVRYLHKVFRDDEQTLNAYIWNLRVERCAEDLIDPAKQSRSITEIAFSWGFKNAGHFSRLFKQRHGVSARAYRRAPPRIAPIEQPPRIAPTDVH